MQNCQGRLNRVSVSLGYIYMYMYILKYRASLSSILSSISPTAKIGTVGGGTVVPHQLSSF